MLYVKYLLSEIRIESEFCFWYVLDNNYIKSKYLNRMKNKKLLNESLPSTLYKSETLRS